MFEISCLEEESPMTFLHDSFNHFLYIFNLDPRPCTHWTKFGLFLANWFAGIYLLFGIRQISYRYWKFSCTFSLPSLWKKNLRKLPLGKVSWLFNVGDINQLIFLQQVKFSCETWNETSRWFVMVNSHVFLACASYSQITCLPLLQLLGQPRFSRSMCCCCWGSIPPTLVYRANYRYSEPQFYDCCITWDCYKKE